MKTYLAALKIITLATAFMLTSGAAWGTQGVPITDRDIVLQGDPQPIGVFTGKTDEKGVATFSGLKAGRYSVILPNTAFFPVGSSVGTQRGAQVSIAANGKAVSARPIAATKSPAKATVTGKDGKKLVIIIEKDDGTIVVKLTVSHNILADVSTTR